jgi:hypothetical protein
MSIQANFVAKRPNKDADFFWESTNADVVSIHEFIAVLTTQYNVVRSFTKSDDELSYTNIFTLDTMEEWTGFMSSILETVPDFLNRRNLYFINAGHSVDFQLVDTDNGTVITELLDLQLGAR